MSKAAVIDRGFRTESSSSWQDSSKNSQLARTLLLLARYGEPEASHRPSETVSRNPTEMVGTTRSRVNVFMNEFRKLGFIDYNGDLKSTTLLSLVLRD